MKALPNALSFSRVILAAVFLATYSATDAQGYIWGASAVGIGFITDRLDGFLARRLKVVSELGFVLDGLGDRAFYVAFVLALVATHHLSLVIAWLIVFREVMIYAVRVIESGSWRDIRGEFRWMSYVYATAMQLWILSYLIADGVTLFSGYNLHQNLLVEWLQFVLLISTVVVGYIIILKNVSSYRERYLVG
jgi:phosphatidylglycerophosphate synthase